MTDGPGAVDSAIDALLGEVTSVAVVGVSPDPRRASHRVAAYLIESTPWEIHLVNPTIDAVFGRRVHARLADLPIVPDLVDVFRRADHLPSVTDEAIAVGAGALWFQLGLRDDDAAALASAAGLTVVQDRCLMVEHRRRRASAPERPA